MQCCANIGQYWTTATLGPESCPDIGPIFVILANWKLHPICQHWTNILPILFASRVHVRQGYIAAGMEKKLKNYFFRNYFKVLGLLHRAKQTYDLKQNARYCTCDYCVEFRVIRPIHRRNMHRSSCLFITVTESKK